MLPEDRKQYEANSRKIKKALTFHEEDSFLMTGMVSRGTADREFEIEWKEIENGINK